MVAPYRLSARLFSLAGKRACIDANDCGAMIAAEMPCSRRPAMSTPGDDAKPHNAEAMPKPSMPPTKTRLRP
jgi:hypothetical protein